MEDRLNAHRVSEANAFFVNPNSILMRDANNTYGGNNRSFDNTFNDTRNQSIGGPLLANTSL